MNTRTVILFSLVLLISCANNSAGGNLSSLGFYATPDVIISKLQKKQNEFDEHFLLGIAYKKEKKYKESIFHFANSCFKSHREQNLRLFPQPVYHFVTGVHIKSPYYDDAVFEIANLFYHFNEHAYVVKFAGLVSNDDRILYRDAMLLQARSLVALGKFSNATSTLKEIISQYSDPDSRSVAYLRMGSLYEKKSDYASAVDNYLKVFSTDPRGWQAAIAAKHMVKIIEKNPQKLDPKNNQQYAKALYHAKLYRESIPLLNSLKTTNTDNQEINILLIKSLARNNEAGAAESLIAYYSGRSGQYIELLKAYADELWEMNRRTNALPLYQRIIKTGAEPASQESLRRMAQYMEEKKQAGYDKYLADYINKYSDDEAGHFLWLQARNLIRGKNMEGARRLLEESVSRYPRGGYSDECRFWLYKIYKEKARLDDALKTAMDSVVQNPDSPYTWLLIKQLAANYSMTNLETGYHDALDKKNRDLALFYHVLLFAKEKSLDKRSGRISDLDSPDIARLRDLEKAIIKQDISSKFGRLAKNIEKYFRIGHIAAINREMKIIPKAKEYSRDKYIIMAHYSNKYRYAYYTVYAYLELLKLWKVKENIALMPDESLKMLFPAPFSDCVARNAKNYNIEDSVLYSVMKAESLFKHKAVSSAGARGLMQLMPGTAKGIARNLKLADYDLSDPCISIQLGAKYISGLLKNYRNNFQYMVAAYNAGAGNVDKWKGRFPAGDMDYFTEFTPFIETRYYILRTDKFLTQYKMIYGKK